MNLSFIGLLELRHATIFGTWPTGNACSIFLRIESLTNGSRVVRDLRCASVVQVVGTKWNWAGDGVD